MAQQLTSHRTGHHETLRTDQADFLLEVSCRRYRQGLLREQEPPDHHSERRGKNGSDGHCYLRRTAGNDGTPEDSGSWQQADRGRQVPIG